MKNATISYQDPVVSSLTYIKLKESQFCFIKELPIYLEVILRMTRIDKRSVIYNNKYYK